MRQRVQPRQDLLGVQKERRTTFTQRFAVGHDALEARKPEGEENVGSAGMPVDDVRQDVVGLKARRGFRAIDRWFGHGGKIPPEVIEVNKPAR